MKKICFITESIYDLGGLQRIVTTLSNEFSKYYEVTIICLMETKNKLDYGLSKSVKVINLKNSFVKKIFLIPFKIVRKINKKIGLYKYDSSIYDLLENMIPYYNRRKLIKYFKNNKFSYVICTGLPCCILMSMMKEKISQPMIGWWHSSYENYVNSKKYAMKRIKNSLKKMDLTIVLSTNDKRLIEENFNVNTEVLYNPIRIDEKMQCSTLQNKEFLAVGRYHSIKRFDLLIKAFYIFHKSNKEWKLSIVGEGEEHSKLQQLINKLELNEFVNLTGVTNDIDKFYKRATAFLMTSKSEGFPTVILEAMSYGLPIIAFDIPVFKEMLNEKNSFILEQGDIEGFAEKMLIVANNFEKREEMAKNSIENVKKFDIKNVMNEWIKILK